MTTQVKTPWSFINYIAIVRSQIPWQLTAKMICGLISLTFADLEVRTVRMSQVLKCRLA